MDCLSQRSQRTHPTSARVEREVDGFFALLINWLIESVSTVGRSVAGITRSALFLPPSLSPSLFSDHNDATAASYRPALFTPIHIGWDDGIVIAGLDCAILILRSMCLSLQANQSVKLYSDTCYAIGRGQ